VPILSLGVPVPFVAELYYYLTDAMGSAIGLADGTGAEVGDFRYDSFGNLRSARGCGGCEWCC
jgi:hypothetical protein